MDIPYVDLSVENPELKDRMLEAVEQVLEHGYYILGEEVERLEGRLAEYLDVADVVGVGSGTDALELALRARGIGRGDEVITVSHTYVSTVSAIRLSGAEPVLVDIEPETMTMDPEQLEEAITEDTAAVMPVHLYGYPADNERIYQICKEYDLALIEDCAQAFGTEYQGRRVGGRDIGCFSLHPLKVFGACGDGGFISLRDESVSSQLRKLRNNGLENRNNAEYTSRNSRLDTLQAALLLEKLDYVDEWIEKRREHAQAYRKQLDSSYRRPPEEPDGTRAVYSMFVVRHPERDKIRRKARAEGIDVKIHYPKPVHQQSAFEHLSPPGRLPVTEKTVDEILSLPVSPALTADDRQRVIEVLNEVAPR
jgi:dTDP-4-amino-4,6-dideoxygalactose transaminase